MYNVMVVDDQQSMKQLFEMIISSSEKYHLTATVSNASFAELYCIKYPIHLILMDVLTSFGSNGLDAAEKIKKSYPNIKVIIVTSMPECSYIDRARKIGVDSFWYKDVSAQPLLELMDRTMAGESIYPDRTPELRLGLASSFEFTKSELKVLRELTSGDTNSVIAERLNISLGTVKDHIKHMMQKTGFKSRTELAVQARTSGLVILGERRDESR